MCYEDVCGLNRKELECLKDRLCGELRLLDEEGSAQGEPDELWEDRHEELEDMLDDVMDRLDELDLE